MIDLVQQFLAKKCSPSRLIDGLAKYFPLLRELGNTPQDPEWHAEGDVRIHTEMVLSKLLEEIESQSDLEGNELHALVLGAALHDIGKAKTTREKIIDGEIRIVSPRHAETGRSYVAPRLGGASNIDEQTFHWTLGIVGYHHHPRKLVSGNNSPGKFYRIARSVPLRLLWIFERADILGRVCKDAGSQLEIIELFRLEAESLGVFESGPYGDWPTRITEEFGIAKQREREYVLEATRFSLEHGEILTLEEGIGKTWDQRSDHGRLVVLCGPSGSGKSSWIHRHCDEEEFDVISLDGIRTEISGRRSSQADNGKVAQLAKERLKRSLNQKNTVIWDATCLREDGRRALFSLAHRYGAASEIVRFAISPGELERRNRDREFSVPKSVLEKQIDRFQWPALWEAQRVATIRETKEVGKTG